jgi:hypothetical protein
MLSQPGGIGRFYSGGSFASSDSEHLERQMAIFVWVSEISDNEGGLAIYAFHQSDLVGPLRIIGLVDADRVDPEFASAR